MLDAGAERRLQHGLVGRGDRAPAHRVEERVELGRVVEPVSRVGQGVLVVGDRAALQLPDHAELLVAGVVLDADQGHQVRRPAGQGRASRRPPTRTTSAATHCRFRTVTSCPGAGAAPFPRCAVIPSAVTNITTISTFVYPALSSP